MKTKIIIFIIILVLTIPMSYYFGFIRLPKSFAYDCSSITNPLLIEIEIGKNFEPSAIDAFVCDKIKFRAIDNRGHRPAIGTIKSNNISYPGFDAEDIMKVGENYEVLLNRSGDYTFYDKEHPEIIGFLSIHKEPRIGRPPTRP